MQSDLIKAAIISAAIVVAGFLAGGRYALSSAQNGEVVRLDRWTGKVELCDPGAFSGEACGVLEQRVAANAAPPCRDGKAECEPWEREWPPEASLPPGTVVTRDGKMTPSEAAQ
ncbi:MAG: hypothetical protein EON58_02440 [Alphaproteobacteria bacterium]|nr:MAG: hypothetical protein EON58_02440 [Alphaproteobacteria bacterium]